MYPEQPQVNYAKAGAVVYIAVALLLFGGVYTIIVNQFTKVDSIISGYHNLFRRMRDGILIAHDTAVNKEEVVEFEGNKDSFYLNDKARLVLKEALNNSNID